MKTDSVLYGRVCSGRISIRASLFIAPLIFSLGSLVSAQTLTVIEPPAGADRFQLGTISDDGKTVLGNAYFQNLSRPAIWTADEGAQLLAAPAGASARTMSRDGNLFLIDANSENGTSTLGLYRDGTFVDYASISHSAQLTATATSADGTRVVGGFSDAISYHSFLWSEETGFSVIPNAPGYSAQSMAYSITRDGKVVMGIMARSLEQGGAVPYRWTAETGTVAYEWANGADVYPRLISDDGQQVIASVPSSTSREYRWRIGSAPQPLEIPVGFETSFAADVSANAQVVTGSVTGDDGRTSRAVLWGEDNKAWFLEDILRQNGIEPEGWSFTDAGSISGDSRYLLAAGALDGMQRSVLFDFGPAGLIMPAAVPEPASYSALAGLLIVVLAIFRRKKR